MKIVNKMHGPGKAIKVWTQKKGKQHVIVKPIQILRRTKIPFRFIHDMFPALHSPCPT